MAEDGTPPVDTKAQELSTDPELRPIQVAEAKAKRAEAEAAARKAAAEADKARTDAETAAFTAAFPKGSAEPLEGKVEVDEKVGLVGDLLAHSMMRRAAEEIRNDIRGLLKRDQTKILLVNSPDLIGADWPYVAISEQVCRQKQELEELKASLTCTLEAEVDIAAVPEAVVERVQAIAGLPFANYAAAAGKAVQAVSSVASDVAQIAALFRADYKIAAKDVAIGASTLLAAVAHFLVERAKEVNVESFSLLEHSKLIREFAAAARLREEVHRLMLERKELDLTPVDGRAEMAKEVRSSYLAALTAESPPSETYLALLANWVQSLQEEVSEDLDEVAAGRADVAVAAAAIQRFDALAAGLLQAPAEGEDGYPPLIAAAIRERLHDEEEGYTHVLYAGVEAASGESVTRRSFLKPSIRFIGGAQVTYLFYDLKKKRLAAADTRPFLASAKMRLGSGFVGGAETVHLG